MANFAVLVTSDNKGLFYSTQIRATHKENRARSQNAENNKLLDSEDL